MSFKCTFCLRTFSRRSAYTRHVNKCILTAESSDEFNEQSLIESKSLNISCKSPKLSDDINACIKIYLLLINTL